MLFAGAVFLTIGGLMILNKYDVFYEWRRVKNTPTITAQAAAVGQVDIEGQISAVSESYVSPLRQQPCVLYCWEVSEEAGDNWKRIESGICSDRLAVTDSTGMIHVRDPSQPSAGRAGAVSPRITRKRQSGSAVTSKSEYKAIIEQERTDGTAGEIIIYCSSENEHSTTFDQRVPSELEELFTNHGIPHRSSTRRQYRELVLPPDEVGYVHGELLAPEAHDGQESAGACIDISSNRGKLLIADRPESEFVDLLEWYWRGLLYAGLIFFVLGAMAFFGGLAELL